MLMTSCDQVKQWRISPRHSHVHISSVRYAVMCCTLCVEFLTGESSVTVCCCAFRICFCTADRVQERVFAYIARNRENETMECHAFLCPKRKIVSCMQCTINTFVGILCLYKNNVVSTFLFQSQGQ